MDDQIEKLIEKNDTLEAIVTVLKEQVAKLKGELTICKVVLGNGMLASGLKQHRMDVLNSKEFEGTRSARDVDNFFLGIKQYFHAIGIEDEIAIHC